MKKILSIIVSLFLLAIAVCAYAFKPATLTTPATLPPAEPPIVSVKPIRILLVPGHDNQYWGAQFGKIKEADMNLVLATQVYDILSKDKRFKVFITRDQNGYTKEFADYYAQHKTDIASWEASAKKNMQNEIASGSFVTEPGAPHHTVINDIALRLYGFNKWAGENKIDAMIHMHFNDYPMATLSTIGKYTGLAVYVPEGQLSNSKTSAALGTDIMNELLTKYSKSNFPPEKAGLVPDQKLIALGANGTLPASVSSVLVEYEYMYQKILRTVALRQKQYSVMAELTAKGIQDYYYPVVSSAK